MSRSVLCDSSFFSFDPGEHKCSSNLKIDSGRYGTSVSSRLKDLSEAGKESLSVSACIYGVKKN